MSRIAVQPDMPRRILLGPQRPTINVDIALVRSEIDSEPIGVISAGWQEAEGDIGEVQKVVGKSLVDLGLYRRAEQLFAADQALHDAYRLRQNRLKELQRLYRQRLRQLMIAARQTLRLKGEASVIDAERRHAISQLRALDRHHMNQVQKANLLFRHTFDFERHDLFAEHAAAIREILSRCKTVMITGGNIVILINRLKLFGIDQLLEDKHIIAWSAGAMALSDRIVLFHDKLPQGRRDPELLGEGAGILPTLIFLPEAARRLRKKDQVRAGLLSRRFSPVTCVTLDSGSMLLFDGQQLTESESVRRITSDGYFRKLHPK